MFFSLFRNKRKKFIKICLNFKLPKLHLITDSSSSEVEEPLHSKSADSGLKAVASIRGEEEKPKIESEVGEDFNFLSEGSNFQIFSFNFEKNF